MLKKILKTILIIVLVIIALVVCYVVYVFAAYSRVGDMDLVVSYGTLNTTEISIDKEKEYTLISYNIGFGAYEDDYSFFMDGGTQSWAWSKERLSTNLNNISSFLNEQDADFYLIQEVDLNSTRSYHVNEMDVITSILNPYCYTSAVNYNSPFLFYPLTQPHGKSKSCLLTMSDYNISASSRVELPVESGIMKMFDLDRCYSKNIIKIDDNINLVLYNLHLSAYTSDGTIAIEQLQILLADMQSEYEKGNYCVAGGDFNKDLLGNSAEIFGKDANGATWAQPISDDLFTNLNITKIAPIDASNPIPSCRNADAPYNENQFVVTVDGFLVSDNIEVTYSNVIDLEFKYSDHNPVKLMFKFR